uniref:Glutaredoxin-3 n=1 Tax=Caligus clemensi TaxID=344056 RepID=C1C2X1_CALCM|nr:Glutaredoxin-3 [Caligus clemensi]
MSITDIKSAQEFDKVIQEDHVSLIHFWVPWARECPTMNDVIEELAKEEPRSRIYRLEAEEVKDIPSKYNVHAVPTFLFFRRGQMLEQINGAHPVKVVTALKSLLDTPSDALPVRQVNQEDIHKRCKKLIHSNPVMLFMKGNPENPKCKFSRATIEIMNTYTNTKYSTFDILMDESIRQGLKEYSKWPTYPQLYINGDLVGGIDIIKEMHKEGELEAILPKKKDLDTRLKELTNQSPVVVFMKGEPNHPKCGFSGQLIAILSPLNIDFTTFNILEDEEVRQGLKTFSNWPTYPQVYAKGEFIGGLDIIKELQENPELLSALKPE